MYDELKHHGIKGQKWGIRRFQNKNGGLTPAGRTRYDDMSARQQKKVIRKEVKSMKKEGTAVHNRPLREAMVKNGKIWLAAQGVGVVALKSGKFNIAAGAEYASLFAVGKMVVDTYKHGKQNAAAARDKIEKER